MSTTGTVACLCGTVHVISTGSVVRPGQRYCPKCAPRIADDPWNAAPADSAQATHPCGCPADTVTTPLRGFRAQCGSCAAVFDVPARPVRRSAPEYVALCGLMFRTNDLRNIHEEQTCRRCAAIAVHDSGCEPDA